MGAPKRNWRPHTCEMFLSCIYSPYLWNIPGQSWTWIYTCCAPLRALWTVPVLWLTGQAVGPVNWTCECEWARTSEFYLSTSTCLWTWIYTCCAPVRALWTVPVLWLTGQAVGPVNWTCECNWARTSEFYLSRSTCLWTEYIPVVWVPPVSCLWSLTVLTCEFVTAWIIKFL